MRMETTSYPRIETMALHLLTLLVGLAVGRSVRLGLLVGLAVGKVCTRKEGD